MTNTDDNPKPVKVYLSEEIGLPMFLSEKIIVTRGSKDKILAKEFYKKYMDWCKARNCFPYTRYRFYSNFGKAGNIYSKYENGNRKCFLKSGLKSKR